MDTVSESALFRLEQIHQNFLKFDPACRKGLTNLFPEIQILGQSGVENPTDHQRDSQRNLILRIFL